MSLHTAQLIALQDDNSLTTISDSVTSSMSFAEKWDDASDVAIPLLSEGLQKHFLLMLERAHEQLLELEYGLQPLFYMDMLGYY